MTTLSAYTNSPTYQQERRAALIRSIPQVALGATDVYAAGVCVLTPTSRVAQTLPWVAGVAAVAHGIYGLTELLPSDERTRTQQVRGYGSMITAIGFAGLAAGLGPWALPIIGLGETTRLMATIIGREE